VIRGGNWNNNARNCRSANRNRNNPTNTNNNIGFRVSSTLNSRNSAVMGGFQSAEARIGVQSASGHGGSPCEEKPARRGLVGNERPRRARRDTMECVPPGDPLRRVRGGDTVAVPGRNGMRPSIGSGGGGTEVP